MLCQMTPRSFLDGRIQLWGGVNRAVTHSSLTCGLVPRCSPVFVWQSKLALCYSLLVAPEGNSSWLRMHVLKHSAKSSLSHNVYCWLPLLWKNRRKKSPVIGHVRVVCLLTSAALWAQIKGDYCWVPHHYCSLIYYFWWTSSSLLDIFTLILWIFTK